jgi:hypothetical protein
MTITAFLTLALGILLLLFGRRVFWLFVATAGFIAGLTFAMQFMSGQPELVILLIAIIAGIIGVFLGVLLEGVAILIAGFLAGGYLATPFYRILGNLHHRWHRWAASGSGPFRLGHYLPVRAVGG